MEHVAFPLPGRSSRRVFVTVATVVAVGALLVLVALVGLRLFAAARTSLKGTRPVSVTGQVPKVQVGGAIRPRSRSSILVLNGNGVNGAAGNAATQLLHRGYRHAVPADAPNSAYARSLVLYRPGWEREAQRLARDAHVGVVAPLDGRLPRSEAAYPLVLILGF